MDAPAFRWARVGNAALAAWFIILSVMRLARLTKDQPFSDSTLYLRGTAAWLRGKDPWTVHIGELITRQRPGVAAPRRQPVDR